MKEFLQYIVPLICAVIAYLSVRQGRENRRLRKRLRIALEDCMALWTLESTLCEQIGDHLGATALSIKRKVREYHRGLAIPTPSEEATPQHIRSELARL
jgi:hypothetical protein